MNESTLDRLDRKYVVKRWRDETHLRQLLDDIAKEMNYLSGYGIATIKVKAEELNFIVDYENKYLPYKIEGRESFFYYEFQYALRFVVGHSVGRAIRLVIPRLNSTIGSRDLFKQYDPDDNLLQIKTTPFGSKRKKKKRGSRYHLSFDQNNPILESFLRRISENGELEPNTSTQWQHFKRRVGFSDISWWYLPESQTTLYKVQQKRRREDKQRQAKEREQRRLEKTGVVYKDRKKTKKSNQVYIIKMQDESLAETVYKIGISNAPGKRLQTLNTSSPFELTMVHRFVAEPAEDAEKQLHAMYQNTRLSGEWFRLTREQLADLKGIIEFKNGKFIK